MEDYNSLKMIDFLQSKWGTRECPMCQESVTWLVPNHIFVVAKYAPTDPVPDNAVVPVIPVTCNNCGFTVLVSAIVPGFLDKNSGKDAITVAPDDNEIKAVPSSQEVSKK